MKKIFLLLIILITSLTEMYGQTAWEICNGQCDIRKEMWNSYSIIIKDSNIFVGTYDYGIYISTDYGITWSSRERFMGQIAALSFATKDNYIFAGTEYGISKSSDNGNTWGVEGINNPGLPILSLIINGSNIFAGSLEHGIYKSTDDGNSWNVINEGLPVESTVRAIAISGEKTFIGTNNGLFVSTNDGNNWTEVNTGDFLIYDLLIDSSNIFIASPSGLFVSTDFGITWSEKKNGPLEIYSISLTKNGNRIYACSYGKILYTTDNGTSWKSTTQNAREIAINGTDIFAVSDYGGVSLSKDSGDSWSPIISCMYGKVISEFVAYDNNLFAATYRDGIYLSTDFGNSWSSKKIGLTDLEIRAIAYNKNTLWAGTDAGKMFMSTDDGYKWILKSTGIPDSTSIRSIAINTSDIFIGTSKGIYLSTDNGNKWISKNNGLNDLEISKVITLGNNIIICTRGQQGLYLSSDYGGSWKNIDLFDSIYVSTIDVNNGEVYVGTSIGIFLSTDNGNKWILISQSLPEKIIRSIKVIGMNIFAITDNTMIFLSSDKGLNWKSIIDDYRTGNSYYTALGFCQDYIFTCIKYWNPEGSLRRAKLSDLGVSVEDIIISSNNNFSISPNPATDYIDITLASKISSSKNDDIKIYNVLGDKVHSVSIQNLDQQHIDISSFPAGLYFVRYGSEYAKFIKE